MIRVWSSPSRWKVTTPECPLPSVVFQAMRSSGRCSVISASHSLRGAGDLGLPAEVRVVDLVHVLDALHELRELLELRPLVVGGPDRNVDVDGLLDCRGHEPPCSVSGPIPESRTPNQAIVQTARTQIRLEPATFLGHTRPMDASVEVGQERGALPGRQRPDPRRQRRPRAERHDRVRVRVQPYGLHGDLSRSPSPSTPQSVRTRPGSPSHPDHLWDDDSEHVIARKHDLHWVVEKDGVAATVAGGSRRVAAAGHR